jgi:hypothetical protein
MAIGDFIVRLILFFFLFAMLEFGLPQYMRMVGGGVFGTSASLRDHFYAQFRRGRTMRFGIGLIDGIAAAALTTLNSKGEVQGVVLAVAVALYAIVVGIGVWGAYRRVRPNL